MEIAFINYFQHLREKIPNVLLDLQISGLVTMLSLYFVHYKTSVPMYNYIIYICNEQFIKTIISILLGSAAELMELREQDAIWISFYYYLYISHYIFTYTVILWLFLVGTAISTALAWDAIARVTAGSGAAAGAPASGHNYIV